MGLCAQSTFSKEMTMNNKSKEAFRRKQEALRAVAKNLHNEGNFYGWAGPHFKLSFEEFEQNDPIGFNEWMSLVECAVQPLTKLRK